MTTEVEVMDTCPFCTGPLDGGCILGNISALNDLEHGLQWFAGEPTWKNNLMKLGEPVGKFKTLVGSYALGKRCRKCRKIILDY